MKALLAMLKKGRQLSHSQKLLIGFSTSFIICINYISLDVLVESWPIIGIIFAACNSIIYFIAFIRGGGAIHSSTQFSLCILGLAVTLLQYEENGVDLMNRESHFTPYSNNILGTLVPFFKCEDSSSCAFDPANVMAFNTIGLWLPFFLLPFLYTTNPLFGLFVIAYAVGNVAGLTGAAVWTLSYAPGMVSGIVLVLPTAYWCVRKIIRHQFHDDRLLFVVCLLSSPWLFGCIAGLVFTVNITHILPAAVWPVFMAIASVCIPYIFGKAFGFNIESYHERLRSDQNQASESESLL